ncbi:MAG: hypothetical protein KVP17_000179 [Porospora cf. gigantea B]|uniref:uncharacterized protein n=1 Tax=Porospora cf. gigantea B TaxID=2853592 RepID=UPI0035718BC5|nr:MAG: hypothetical protein KVP17_000179 [Porospora cf. gigantea B]
MPSKQKRKSKKFEKAFSDIVIDAPIDTESASPAFSLDEIPKIESRETIPRYQGTSVRVDEGIGLTRECPLTMSTQRANYDTRIEWMGAANDQVNIDPILGFLERNRGGGSSRSFQEVFGTCKPRKPLRKIS